MMSGVRVLYLIGSMERAGAEASLASMAPDLIRRGVDLHVAHLKDGSGIEGELVDAGATVHRVPGHGTRLGRARVFARLTGQIRADLVHTTLFDADVVGRVGARLAHVPVVSSLVSTPYGPEHMSDPRLKPWKVRTAQAVDAGTGRLVRRFHALTGHVARVMSSRLWIPRSRIDVIPRGRDPIALGRRSRDRSFRMRESLRVDPSAPLVLAAARQEYQKGLDILLTAWPTVRGALPDATLVVAGRQGNQTPELMDLLSRLALQDSVRMLGPRDDVPDLLCAADVFVMPSRWEGFGGILLEAMALETPVVASDIEPIREVLGDGHTAALVSIDDPSALSDAIVQALNDRDRSTAQAERARERFLQEFTVDRVAERMVSFYERALGRAASKTRADMAGASR